MLFVKLQSRTSSHEPFRQFPFGEYDFCQGEILLCNFKQEVYTCAQVFYGDKR